MKKKIRLFLCMFLMLISMFNGCTSTSGQHDLAEDNTQIQDYVAGDFEETESQEDFHTEMESGNATVNEIQQDDFDTENNVQDLEEEHFLDEDGSYTSKEEVAAYLHQYGKLPSNFITKKEAKKLGWVNTEGNLGEVAPGKSIGGDYFGNYEGQLPEKDGRDYYECDINTDGSYRGAERIVFSDDGLIYYTADHYDSFELLYGDE